MGGCTGQDDWCTRVLLIPREEISYVTSILEAYDNQFLVRTQTKGLGIVRVWLARPSLATLDEVIREMRGEFPVDVIATEEGMTGLEEIYPE